LAQNGLHPKSEDGPPRIRIIWIGKLKESEIGDETVTVEKTAVATEASSTEKFIMVMPKMELRATAPGAKQVAGSGFAKKKEFPFLFGPIAVTRFGLCRDQ
jgi:hypothetical protein